jgi:hypothetical protein
MLEKILLYTASQMSEKLGLTTQAIHSRSRNGELATVSASALDKGDISRVNYYLEPDYIIIKKSHFQSLFNPQKK